MASYGVCKVCKGEMSCPSCEKKADPSPWFSKLVGKIDIANLAKKITSGKWGLVTFQRDSVWGDKEELELFNSLFFGVPVGVIYAWKTRQKETKSKRTGETLSSHPSRSFSGFESNYGTGKNATHLILDGQQRLTTLAKLHASITKPEIMLPLIANLDKLSNPGNNIAFRYAKNSECLTDLRENEIYVQDLIKLGLQNSFRKEIMIQNIT